MVRHRKRKIFEAKNYILKKKLMPCLIKSSTKDSPGFISFTFMKLQVHYLKKSKKFFE